MVELNTWAGLEPAVMDIKTVSGLAQVFELTLTDSTGSVVDLEGVTFRGAVNTAPCPGIDVLRRRWEGIVWMVWPSSRAA